MSIILEKSQKLAIRIYHLYKHLYDEKQEHMLSTQMFHSGTSFGAYIAESQYAVNRNDFITITKKSLKECAETEYWLCLLKDIDLLSREEYANYIVAFKEISRLLIATLKTADMISEDG